MGIQRQWSGNIKIIANVKKKKKKLKNKVLKMDEKNLKL